MGWRERSPVDALEAETPRVRRSGGSPGVGWRSAERSCQRGGAALVGTRRQWLEGGSAEVGIEVGEFVGVVGLGFRRGDGWVRVWWS